MQYITILLIRAPMLLSGDLWQGGVCLAFADEVLCWLYGTVKESKNPNDTLFDNRNLINCWKVVHGSS